MRPRWAMREPFRLLDLFSGIGGFSLGLERTGGFRTVAFCEIDPYCRRVLAKHWPGVPIHDDIRTLSYAYGAGCQESHLLQQGRSGVVGTRSEISDAQGKRCRQGRPGRIVACGKDGTPARDIADGPIDVICGGFPCQDISAAGQGAGITGERSGLWFEMSRVIGEVRPRYALIENVSALLGRGLHRVLSDLAALGYDAEWHCIPASAVGAPHRRDRIWIVANVRSEQHQGAGHANGRPTAARFPEVNYCEFYSVCYDPNQCDDPNDCWLKRHSECEPAGWREEAGLDPDAQALLRASIERGGANRDHAGAERDNSAGNGGGTQSAMGLLAHGFSAGLARGLEPDPWGFEPLDAPRVLAGVPDHVNKLRSLGNAVVPQIPELIGRAILEAEAGK